MLVAPIYEQAALDALQQKEAIRILADEERRAPDAVERDFARCAAGCWSRIATATPSRAS